MEILNVKAPDDIVWAFNPNYVEVTLKDCEYHYLVVTVGDNEPINVVLYNQHANICISRLLQLCFPDPKFERVKDIRVVVKTPDLRHGSARFTEVEVEWDDENENESVTVLDQTFTVVWGGINLGERAFNYGVYNYDEGRGWLTSHLQCFVNFPFCVELLAAKDTKLYRRTKGSYTLKDTYTKDRLVVLSKDEVMEGVSKGRVVYRQELNKLTDNGTFDSSFDYTFHLPSDTTVITHLHLRNEKEGYYLRWINHFGFIQYYLFDKGEKTTTTKDKIHISHDIKVGNMYFSGNRRNTKDVEQSIKVCAVNLDPNTLTYVRDVVCSPFVDLYIGKDKHGVDIWMPITIEEGSYAEKTQHNYLSDLELTIKLPNCVTQTI